MASVTLGASSALGIYCKVLVGDAKFRADMVGMVTDCILRWMSVNSTRCFLFGKRAWNAHLSDRTLEESTTDVDMILYDPSTFPSMTLDLLRVINEECVPALIYMHSFTKTHADKRGKTFTVEICGVSVADLSMRNTPGDFCLVAASGSSEIGSSPLPPHDHFSVLRNVYLTTGETIRVSVLRVRVMESMLEAEIASYHWRKDKAEKELRKYMMFAALGFISAEEEEGCGSSKAAEPLEWKQEQSVVDEYMHESSFQLPVLAQYIRQCGTLDECRRIATTLFYWREGDRMHECVSGVCAAKTIDECRAIARKILEAVPN